MDDKTPQPEPGDAADQPATEASVQEALADAQASVEQMQQQVASAASAADAPESEADGAIVEGIELLGDVDLNVMIELGRTEMLVEDVLKLQGGSVVELDKLAGDPVDVYVNGRLVARGEVLVLNDNFCIRISEIVANLEEQAEAAAEQQAEAAAESVA